MVNVEEALLSRKNLKELKFVLARLTFWSMNVVSRGSPEILPNIWSIPNGVKCQDLTWNDTRVPTLGGHHGFSSRDKFIGEKLLS
ncbi:unnamed protein product [Sphenostylis stenocarpa]|uniref:Uncharacterized protein n=1 Tax=Sphenostylis stenocarpa TaxID=92480 RepID=A0AA86V305_9FABA|nr:unnamed protein product [Sphenostylis stenocarpa]